MLTYTILRFCQEQWNIAKFDIHTGLITWILCKGIERYRAVSDRVIMIKLQAKPLDITPTQVYAPTSSSDEEVLEDFMKTLKEQWSNVTHMRIASSKVISMPKWEREGLRTLLDLMAWEPRMSMKNVWFEWLKQHDMIIGNTWFKVPACRKWTWRSPDSNTLYRNQIGYILIGERFRNALTSCKAYPGVDCGSDHNPVIAKVYLKLRKLKKEEAHWEARPATQTE